MRRGPGGSLPEYNDVPGPPFFGEVRITLTLKECLVGLWVWPRYRFASRCWACGRPMALHSPWAVYDCSRTPMAISFTEKGEALAVIAEAEDLIA
jgi:hypothetical protein